MKTEDVDKILKEFPGKWAACKVLSINLEEYTVEIAIPPTIVEKGVHAGFVFADFSGISD